MIKSDRGKAFWQVDREKVGKKVTGQDFASGRKEDREGERERERERESERG